ncbi:MAG: hypothetical protein ACRDV6_05605 [Acidimicrobiales bacterium]
MASLPLTGFIRSPRALRWIAMVQGLVVTFAIAAPTLVIEEDWHGRPMIDQPGHLWVVPTFVVAAAFTIGGLLCARRTTESSRALVEGLGLGATVAGTFLVIDVVRRAARHQALSQGVFRLWVEAALLSVVLASLGAAMGHLYATRER